jgi:hypothetical protein
MTLNSCRRHRVWNSRSAAWPIRQPRTFLGTNGYEVFAPQNILQSPSVLGIAARIAITWPVSGSTCQLEPRADLKSDDWVSVEDAPVVINRLNSVLVPATGFPPEQFHRLRKTN